MFVLKLPLFLTRLHGKEKSAAILKLTCIWTPLCCSYVILALSKIILRHLCRKSHQDVSRLEDRRFGPIMVYEGFVIEFS